MKCYFCEKSFVVEEEPGALLWSPPGWAGLPPNACTKFHLCQGCYQDTIEMMEERRARRESDAESDMVATSSMSEVRQAIKDAEEPSEVVTLMKTHCMKMGRCKNGHVNEDYCPVCRKGMEILERSE